MAYDMLGFLFIAAGIAGFIDTLAGGGGLITIPALILSGIPPHAALGTNKLQSSIGSGTATFIMFKKRKVS
ncbi:MAG TPA: TSUP family transporter, partial [Candidatus Rifleibacterium sp.]|nr:TSUP family transporter [Candidatus Rifleibacterium sp.]